jgi:hypothetical protein
MAVMQIKVSLQGREPVVAPVTPKVIVDAEEHFGTTMVQMFNELSMKRLTWLAWKALLVNGNDVKTYEPFLADLVEVPEIVSQEDSAPLSEA